MTSADDISLEDLERSRKEHIRELRRIERMSDAQFEAFKRNFTLGVLDPSITRKEAMEVLRSMIMTNLSIQQGMTVRKDESDRLPTPLRSAKLGADDERE